MKLAPNLADKCLTTVFWPVKFSSNFKKLYSTFAHTSLILLQTRSTSFFKTGIKPQKIGAA